MQKQHSTDPLPCPRTSFVVASYSRFNSILQAQKYTPFFLSLSRQVAQILREGLTPPTCHVSCVTCHVSCIKCHMSRVACHVSHVTCPIFLFFVDKGLDLVGEGLLSTEPTPSSFFQSIFCISLGGSMPINQYCEFSTLKTVLAWD